MHAASMERLHINEELGSKLFKGYSNNSCMTMLMSCDISYLVEKHEDLSHYFVSILLVDVPVYFMVMYYI